MFFCRRISQSWSNIVLPHTQTAATDYRCLLVCISVPSSVSIQLSISECNRPSYYHHHVWHFACFLFWNVKLVLRQRKQSLPKVLAIVKIFSIKCGPLYYIWSAAAFAWELSHGCHFCPDSGQFLTIKLWTLTLTKTSETFSSSDVVVCRAS